MVKILKKLKTYNIKNLYIGCIGVVEPVRITAANCHFRCNDAISKRYIVMTSDYQGLDKIGISVISGTKYYYFFDAPHFLEFYINQFMIYKEIPLSLYIEKEKLSWTEIKELEDKLNITKEQREKEELDKKLKETKVTDPVLSLILKSGERLNSIAIMDSYRSYLEEQISDLGKEYVDKLIKIKLQNTECLSTVDQEMKLQFDILSKLNLIEEEIKNQLEIGNLNLEYEDFKRKLKK